MFSLLSTLMGETERGPGPIRRRPDTAPSVSNTPIQNVGRRIPRTIHPHPNGCRSMIVCSRSAPVEMMSTGVSVISSSRCR